MDFLKTLTTGKATVAQEKPEPVHYKGFDIQPDPLHEEGQYRVQGWISQGDKRHHFIRADLLPTYALCVEETLRKARVLIDQQGSHLLS
ncbi:HlyU family transcriptional regulator [Sedimenticola sp.]|uniref:HlyU family transcriptional regulator n=1 Tax=Sedimenticola sp. TaxID=1940285 RepID=UPI003D0B5C13